MVNLNGTMTEKQSTSLTTLTWLPFKKYSLCQSGQGVNHELCMHLTYSRTPSQAKMRSSITHLLITFLILSMYNSRQKLSNGATSPHQQMLPWASNDSHAANVHHISKHYSRDILRHIWDQCVGHLVSKFHWKYHIQSTNSSSLFSWPPSFPLI